MREALHGSPARVSKWQSCTGSKLSSWSSPSVFATAFVAERSHAASDSGSPHVKVGARYRMDEGEIEVDSIEPIGFLAITPQLARESGFMGLIDLLKVAKHGKGENVYLVQFHYVPPRVKGS